MHHHLHFIHRRLRLLAALVAWLGLPGCTSLAGLGGSTEFKCSAPSGVPCQSVSGVSANHRAGTLPAQLAARGSSSQAPVEDVATSPPAGRTAAPRRYFSAQTQPAAAPLGAIRSEPTLIRIWLAPWEDADGDLHDQSTIYLQIDAGRWLIEHNRAQIQRAFGAKLSLSGTGAKGAAAAVRPAGAAGTPTMPDGNDLAVAAAKGAALAQQMLRGARLPEVKP
jgi:conjugal transfer pilus assembly protein TraV